MKYIYYENMIEPFNNKYIGSIEEMINNLSVLERNNFCLGISCNNCPFMYANNKYGAICCSRYGSVATLNYDIICLNLSAFRMELEKYLHLLKIKCDKPKRIDI